MEHFDSRIYFPHPTKLNPVEPSGAYKPEVGDVLFGNVVIVGKINQMWYRIRFSDTDTEYWVSRSELMDGHLFDGSIIPPYPDNDLPWH